jgi:hypothetical protein
MNNQDANNKREYSRVEAYIPLEYKLIEPGQRQHVRARVAGETILAEFKTLPDPDDQVITEWLKTINTKLNSIIRMLTLHQEGFSQLTIRKVNISGGGISFNADRTFSPGDVLEIKAMLTMQYPLAVFLYGEVIEVGNHHLEYDTSVQFIATDDFIRDEVIRFVFEREREILREKRK